MIARVAAAGAVVLMLAACSPPEPGVWSNCLVLEKDRVATETAGQSDMRVYTDNCGEFKVEDTWHRSDSARVYGSIQPGKRYDIHATGSRNPRWSEFPNIIAVYPKDPAGLR